MTPAELAQIIAAFLDDRDDIASAIVLEAGEKGTLGVETQGGSLFVVTVADA